MSTPLPIREELDRLADVLKNQYFYKPRSLNYIKSRVLGSNTVRSYKKYVTYTRYKPSSLVKNWLHTDFLADAKNLKAIKEAIYFGPLHQAALNSLKANWQKNEPEITSMQFYHFAKIVDLFFKSLTRWDELSVDRKDWLLQHAHVPIDKWSLTVLKRSHPSYSDIRNLSMKHIGDDEDYYNQIQNDIKQLISPHPRLLFDLYAWDHYRELEEDKETSFDLEPC